MMTRCRLNHLVALLLSALFLATGCGDADGTTDTGADAAAGDVGMDGSTGDAAADVEPDGAPDASDDTSGSDTSVDTGDVDAVDAEPVTPVRSSGVGMTGSCTDPQNLPFLIRFSLTRFATHRCTTRCGSAPESGCIEACFAEEELISDACVDCVAELGSCTQNLCADACPDGWAGTSETCDTCRITSCGVEFTVCAGAITEIPDPPVPPAPALTCRERGGVSDIAAVMSSVSDGCWEDCRLSPAAGDCVEDCLNSEASEDAVCVGCVGEFIDCSRHCGRSCLEDPFQSSCLECAPECTNALETCTVSDVWELVPQVRYGRVRLVNLDDTLASAALVVVGTGAPVARGVGYRSGSVFGEVAEGDTELALTAGAVGPAASLLGRVSLSVLPGGQTSVMALASPDGTELRLQTAPRTTGDVTQARVINALPDSASVAVTVNDNPPVTLDFGDETTVFDPGSSVAFLMEFPDTPPRVVAPATIATGGEVTFVIVSTENASGVAVIAVQSPGSVLLLPSSFAVDP